MAGEPEGQVAAEPAVQHWPLSPDLFSVLLSPRCAQAGWHPVGVIIGQHPWDQRVGQREGGSSCPCSGSAGLGPTGALLPLPSGESADGFPCCYWATWPPLAWTSLLAQWYRIRLQRRRPMLDPWVRKIPGEGNGNPLQRSLAGYSPCGRRVGHDRVTNANANSPKLL